ncbi:MAG: hypothetical protein PHO15_06910 [Eubacteriales bacterium]|nr:hypothetical protein [Eubacteriales bacterium]
MSLKKHVLFIVLCAVTLLTVLPRTALANSAAPPTLIVIVNTAPDDLIIEADVDNRREIAVKKMAAWETHYAFYYYTGSIPSALHVSTGNESYTISLDESDMFGKRYENTLTLDLATRTLSETTLPFRTAMLIALRVVLTLLIEGALFFAFGFRKKLSWVLFIIINLITQGLLNWQLSEGTVFDLALYRMMTLIILEVLVLSVEIPALTVLIREHKAGRRVLFVLTANITSFIAGGLMITLLPI